MFAWLAILVFLIPPLVLAALSPRTQKWRDTRKRFWLTTLAGVATASITLGVIQVVGMNAFFLGPAVFWIGALLVNAIVLAVWVYAAGSLRRERNEWLELQKGKETVAGVPGIDPTKPWKM